jgi:hypothetical protein
MWDDVVTSAEMGSLCTEGQVHSGVLESGSGPDAQNCHVGQLCKVNLVRLRVQGASAESMLAYLLAHGICRIYCQPALH